MVCVDPMEDSMKPSICVRSVSDASTIRTFIIIAILTIAAALYWSSGVAALAEPALATALTTALSGETITVTTLDDVSDFSGSQQVSDLPGPDGRVSFREACTAANNTPGAADDRLRHPGRRVLAGSHCGFAQARGECLLPQRFRHDGRLLDPDDEHRRYQSQRARSGHLRPPAQRMGHRRHLCERRQLRYQRAWAGSINGATPCSSSATTTA